jgi:hypothetical protein
LNTLRDALQAEETLRNEIARAGYQCSLEVLGRPELAFNDSQSAVSRHARDVDSLLLRNKLRSKKSAMIRLLVDIGFGQCADVMTVSRHDPEALVSRAPLTTVT